MRESKGKRLLEILQENYDIETAQDLSSAIKDLFKDSKGLSPVNYRLQSSN